MGGSSGFAARKSAPPPQTRTAPQSEGQTGGVRNYYYGGPSVTVAPVSPFGGFGFGYPSFFPSFGFGFGVPVPMGGAGIGIIVALIIVFVLFR